MTLQPIRRSVLYAPASNARALDKLPSLNCDCVILDLEDAVAPSLKASARDRAVKMVQANRLVARELVVRCNGLDTPWGADDLAAMAQAGPDAVLAPKVESAADLAVYAAALPDAVPLWSMIETCNAVLNLASIARAGRMQALVFGANDLMAEMGARTPSALAPARAMTVMAARAGGLAALDGVHNDFTDDAGFAAACEEAAAYGFDGKSLIHPRQIEGCNRAFSPTAAQIDWARAVIKAFSAPDAEGRGVLAVNGAMVERLHLAQAQRLVAAHDLGKMT